MADLTSTIEIVIGALDETGAGFSSAIGKVEGFAGSIETATQPLADLTAGILAADAAALALGVAMLKWSTDEASQFQTATNEINTLIGLSPELMGEFTDGILEYGATSSQTFEQINQAVYNAISAGVAYEDALDAVRQAELLAVAGKADLNDALNLLVPTLNAYGESTDEAGRYSDVFFQTVRLGQTTIPELAASLGQLAPTAAAVGVPIETLGAALATLTANGIGTSEATTGIKAALSNIIKPSQDAARAADELGVEFGVAALETRGLEGLLQDLYSATGGNVEQMARFFGSTEALNTALSLTSGESARFIGNLEAMESATGSTEAAYRIMADSLENVNVKLGNAVDAVLIKIGGELLPEMTNISRGLTDVFAGIGQGIDAGSFDVPISVVEGFLADLASMLATAAENLPEALALVDWSGFEDAMEGVNEALSGLFDGVDLTTPEGLAEAIQLAVDAFSGLMNVTGGILEGLQPLFDIIGGLVSAFADLDPEVQKAAGLILGLGTTANTVAGAVGSLAGAIGGAAGLTAVLGKTGLVAAAGAAGYAVGTVLNEALSASLSILTGGETTLGGAFYDLVDAMDGSVDGSANLAGALLNLNHPLVDAGKAAFRFGLDLFGANDSLDDLSKTTDETIPAADALGASMGELGDAGKDLETSMASTAMTSAELEAQFSALGTTMFDAADGSQDLEMALLALGFSTPKEAVDQLADSLREMGFDAAADEAERLGIKVQDMSFQDAAGAVADFSTALSVIGMDAAAAEAMTLASELDAAGVATEQASRETTALSTTTGGLVQVLDTATGKWVDIESATRKGTGAVKDGGEELKAAAEKAELMTRASADFILGWEQIQSAERVAIFEARADIAVAQIEADASRTIAAFDAMSSSFQNTGDVLTELFGIWAGLDSGFDKNKIAEWIEREYKIREDLAKSQIALVEAEIRRMEAQTALLERGGVEIKISSDGLDTHLEAFMLTIIDRVRVQVAGSYEDFLLGCGS